jgi:Asp-tRNA(Asn)/Glu-tRNA(Gln) amidotransferase A subunit family amidase
MHLLSFDTQQRLLAGDLALSAYIDALEAHVAAHEPHVLAFIPEEARFARLRIEAEALQRQYPDPDLRPPLYGLLVGVKDIFHVDGFTTRAGSRVPPEALQGPEAASVTAIRQAGALILGKTVTTEFAYFAPGPTRNPHDPAHTPGGSSSGSAAAVGAGLVPLAFGTQTIGSITRPASFCSVIGYKPSYERISRAGVIPLSDSLDHVGLFADDLALAESAAAILAKGWQPVALRTQRLTLGVPEGVYLTHADDEMRAHFERTLAALGAAGHTIKHVPVMADFSAIVQRHNRIVAAEAAATHRDWYARYPDGYHQKTIELIERGMKVNTADLNQARAGREQLRGELTAWMANEGIDLWISPAAPGAAPEGLASTGDPVMNLPWTHSGLPTLGLPTGKNAAGLPLGLQLAGGWYGDEVLFKFGALISGAIKETMTA